MSDQTNAQVALEAASRTIPGIHANANARAEQVIRVADQFLEWLNKNAPNITMPPPWGLEKYPGPTEPVVEPIIEPAIEPVVEPIVELPEPLPPRDPQPVSKVIRVRKGGSKKKGAEPDNETK